MKFKFAPFGTSGAPLLTGQIRVDWLVLPVKDILAQLGYLKQGILGGTLKIKTASPWADLQTEKIQVSIFLPNDAEMEDWYKSASSIPMSWPEISSLKSDYMKRVHPSDFHVIRKQVQAKCLWKVLKPNWRLLSYHLYAPGRAIMRIGSWRTSFCRTVPVTLGK